MSSFTISSVYWKSRNTSPVKLFLSSAAMICSVMVIRAGFDEWSGQNQPVRGVLRKIYYENIQQTGRRTCRSAKQLYWIWTSAWLFSCKFAADFRVWFNKNTSGGLLLSDLKPNCKSNKHLLWSRKEYRLLCCSFSINLLMFERIEVGQ